MAIHNICEIESDHPFYNSSLYPVKYALSCYSLFKGSDFLSMDIKQALYYLGEITGEVTTDDLLENIFSKFCIGK